MVTLETASVDGKEATKNEILDIDIEGYKEWDEVFEINCKPSLVQPL